MIIQTFSMISLLSYIWIKWKILIFPINFVGNVLRQFRFITGIIVKTHMYICFIYNRIVVNIHARTLKLLYIFIWIQVAIGQIASCKFFCSWVLDEIRTLKTRWTNRLIYIQVIINDESGVLEGPVQCTLYNNNVYFCLNFIRHAVCRIECSCSTDWTIIFLHPQTFHWDNVPIKNQILDVVATFEGP